MSSTQLYERCDFRAIPAGRGVIPVLRHTAVRTFVRRGSVLADFTSNTKVSSQCLTLGSSKIDCKQAHYTTLSIKLPENWIPVSSTGMTPPATYKLQCSYSYVSSTGMTSEVNVTYCNTRSSNSCVSATFMTSFVVQFTFKSKRLLG
ncbi:hypothetical protein [Wolbachia endosymbiont (group A) of Pogonocherus hispidulus]|uniref:hypothetical protein n=1 Tax=Wolbachia endosymbiont (group A) of Pogonocherus hispidulus TaxID=3066136 RepID=UPI00333FD2F4